MKITANFTLEEFLNSSTAKRLGISNIPSREHLENLVLLCKEILQPIRDSYGAPIFITSGYRCETLNRLVGGEKTSQHLVGEAADIVCSDNKSLWQLILRMIQRGEITVGQLIDEKNLKWIHISRPTSKHKNRISHL